MRMTTQSAAALAAEQLELLREDYHDFNPSSVGTIAYPTPLEFAKIVSKGLPHVFQVYTPDDCVNGTSPWRACSWSQEDLETKVVQPVDVALTPHGNADALVAVSSGESASKVFVQPATEYLKLKDLFPRLVLSQPQEHCQNFNGPVRYLQSQNSNLMTEALSPLLVDLPLNFDIAKDVLGEPDARNIWIGDRLSVTSIHRDPYENLYLVLRGSKTFRLWAPVDEFSLPTKMVSTGRYEVRQAEKDHDFEVVLDETDQIPWVDLDPLIPGTNIPGKMRIVHVNQGEMLYLPSGWYHHVSQQCGTWDDGSPAPCIAVNYWYDMDYSGEKHVMRQLISRLVQVAREMPSFPSAG
jgi:peptidyl-lysine (3S)-dioxygenase / protease